MLADLRVQFSSILNVIYGTYVYVRYKYAGCKKNANPLKLELLETVVLTEMPQFNASNEHSEIYNELYNK